MADYCFIKTKQEVCYGSSTNIVTWRNIPQFVILNVPEDITLTEEELIKFLERKDIQGRCDDMIKVISHGEMRGQPPEYALVRLGGDMPDRDMRTHFSEDHNQSCLYYDWQRDNKLQENGASWKDWYDPKVKYQARFYHRYGITPVGMLITNIDALADYEEAKNPAKMAAAHPGPSMETNTPLPVKQEPGKKRWQFWKSSNT